MHSVVAIAFVCLLACLYGPIENATTCSLLFLAYPLGDLDDELARRLPPRDVFLCLSDTLHA